MGDCDTAVPIAGDDVLRLRARELSGVNITELATVENFTNDHDIAGVNQASEDCLLQGLAGGAGAKVAGNGRIFHEISTADLSAYAIANTQTDVHVLVAVEDVVGAATF